MGYARRVAYNTVIQIGGRFITTAVSLATVSFLNGGLYAEGWGLYVAVTTFLGFFSVIADMGINLLYLQEISKYPERGEKVTATFLGFRLVTAIVIFAFAPLIAHFIPVYQPLTTAIWIASLGQFFLILNQIFVSIFQANLQMARAMATDIIGRVLILVGVIAVFKYVGSNQLEAVLWVVAGGSLLNMICSYVLARPFHKIRISFDFSVWPSIFIRVLPLAAMSVLGMIHFKADSVILTFYKPAIDVGIYGNAYKIMEVMVTLPAMFAGGLFPAMNQAVLKKDPSFSSFIQKAFDLLLFAVVPLIMVMVVLAPYLMGLLTRTNVFEAARSLQILSFALVPLFVGSLIAHVLIASEKQKELSVVSLIAVIMNIGLNILLIPHYSYYGAAVATLTTEFLTVVMTMWLILRTLKFLPSFQVLKSVIPIGGTVVALVILGERFLSDLYLPSFLEAPRLVQAFVITGSGLALIVLYMLPFVLFRQMPAVVQDRVNQLRKKF
ncbi:MAG: polysaccharide biosynthesis protein [Patescibacteria group bacterium]|jgi:O-antigen/teichoic acid export membrane protein|nr:polysaccharide biosynthesis protein [Patescibacteria group bacterium]